MDWASLLHNNFLIKMAAAIAELLIGFSIAPLARNAILKLHNKRGMDQGVLTFTSSVVSTAIRFIAIIIALGQIGVDITIVVGAFSAVGLGVSLALKENMANVAGGMQILITKPFVVDDYIQIDSLEGTVREIEIMFTTLQTFDNQQVIIPNAQLVANPITNFSKYPQRRIVLGVPVSVSLDLEGFRNGLMDIMKNETRVLIDPAPKTVVGDYTPDGRGVFVKLVCYTTNEDYWDVKFDLAERVHQLQNKMDMTPPVDLVEVKNA